MNSFKKIDIYYIITLLFVLLSANASFFSASNIAWGAVILLMVIVSLEKKLFVSKDLKVIGIFSLIYLPFVALRDYGINSLQVDYVLSDVFFLFKFVLTSYLFCLVLKEKVLFYMVKVIYHLTLISFFFYFFQIVGLGEYIYKYSSYLNLQSSEMIPGYTNFLIFTFTLDGHDYTNSGFVWEPGAYGCFLLMAMLWNFFLNKFTFDKKTYVFIIAILTTASTTDYLGLMIMFFMAYRYRVLKLNFWAVIFLAAAIGLIVFLPNLFSKVNDTYYSDIEALNQLKWLDAFYHRQNQAIPLNRFASMVYIYENFGYKLILGVNNNYPEILNKAYIINISNGIFDFLAKFGVVGLVYLVYRYAKICFNFVIRTELMIYCIVLLLEISFGGTLLFLPYILMFIFIAPKQISVVNNIGNKRKGRLAQL